MSEGQTAGNGANANPGAGGGNTGGEGNTNTNTNVKPGGEGNTGGEGQRTLAEGGGGEGNTNVQAKWPDKWREELTGGDEKRMKRAERWQSPKEIADSYFALEQKLSSGELKTALAKDATPEQVVEWRKANGIPETAEAYEIKLPDGLVLGEGDKPNLDSFKKFAHERNWSPDQVSQATEWFMKTSASTIVQQQEQDKTFRASNEDALRAEWGADFKGNTARVAGMLNSLGDESADYIFNSRGPDGRLFGDSPLALKGLLKLAMESGAYDGPIGGDSSGQGGQSIDQEIASIEKKMGTKEYGKTERARVMELYDMREKQAGRKRKG